jgi:hypothetical protein
MATKSKLNGFVFKKLDEINNGLQIPTGNAVQATESILETTPQPKTIQTEQTNSASTFQKLEIDNSAFTPMTNVVPTIENISATKQDSTSKGLSRRARQRIIPEDLNIAEYGALPDNKARLTYLALHGWSIKPEQRGNGVFYYATRYVKRKKKRFYICPVGNC